MSPFVDVQHKETGSEWSRYFKTDDEADRYCQHMKEDRNMLAAVRKETMESKYREQIRRRNC
jgi:hypothetical protein